MGICMHLWKDAYMYVFMFSMHVCIYAHVYTNKCITYYVIIYIYNNAFQIMYHTRICCYSISFLFNQRTLYTTDSDANDDKPPQGTLVTGAVAASREVEHENEDINLACSNVVCFIYFTIHLKLYIVNHENKFYRLFTSSNCIQDSHISQ